MTRLVLIISLVILTVNVAQGLANSILPVEHTTGSSPWVHNSQVDIRLLSTVSGVGEKNRIYMGLHIILQPHWKIYWRSPGDFGSPLRIDWSRSQNIQDAVITWPAPRRFSHPEGETIGYEGEVVLPIIVTLEQTKNQVFARIKVEYLVCSNVCIPKSNELDLLIPYEPETPTSFAPLIEYYSTRVPGNKEKSGIHVTAATTEVVEEGGIITVEVQANPPLNAPDLFIEGCVCTGIPKVQNDAQYTVMKVRTSRPVPVGTTLTLTLVEGDGERSLESVVSLTAATSSDTLVNIHLLMLSIAFLGGLILNLMPCVLPILSLKMTVLIYHNNSDSQVRQRLIASAIGILSAFLLLAVMTIFLQAVGTTVRWGMQFQQPLFLIAIIIMLVLLSASVWGKVDINLPLCIRNYTGWKQSNAFINGFFSTILATPCSAPFLGTAIGFALTHGPLEITLIFLMLGLGMAFPYFLIATIPSLATYIPKPGHWMLILKHIIGVWLVITIIWLHMILVIQVNMRTSIAISLTTLAMVLLLIIRERLQYLTTSLIVLITGGLMLFLVLTDTSSELQTYQPFRISDLTYSWMPFDEDVIIRHVSAGHVVFVDVTAKWCITCQMNKITVLSRSKVVERLNSIITMRADWTRADQRIAAYLAKFGRYGVPFNVVYGPCVPYGLPLPEILTVENVLSALNTVSGK